MGAPIRVAQYDVFRMSYESFDMSAVAQLLSPLEELIFKIGQLPVHNTMTIGLAVL